MIVYLSRENDTRKNIYPTLIGVRAHPLVEHTAVNRGVVGSSPTRGVEKPVKLSVCRFFILIINKETENFL